MKNLTPKLVTRSEWKALTPTSGQRRGRYRGLGGGQAASKLVLSNTQTVSCFSKTECITTVQRLQVDHMKRLGLPDIRFNFLIGGDGHVYEGRGWLDRAEDDVLEVTLIEDFATEEDQPYHVEMIPCNPEPVVPIVSREEWGAEPPKKQEEMNLPAKFITFSSTRTEECFNKEECTKVIKKMQEEQIKKGLPDILPNFLIGGDGTIYEGRGWRVQGYTYEEEDDMRGRTIDIAYIGKYKEPTYMPTTMMITAAIDLIKLGVYKGFIYKKYNVVIIVFLPCYFGSEEEGDEEVTIVTREEWGAKPPPPEEERQPLNIPVKLVYMGYTNWKRCRNRTECMNVLQSIQSKHIQEGRGDIAYNFLIGGDSHVYEGRGWLTAGSKSLSFTKDRSRDKIEIAFIGNYSKNPTRLPSAAMMKTFEILVLQGVRQNFIRKNHKMVVLDDFANKLLPFWHTKIHPQFW